MREAWIYIFNNGNEGYKIGYTAGEVEKRFKALSTGNPNLSIAKIVHFKNSKIAKMVENIMHNAFNNKHIKGNSSKEFFLVEIEKINTTLDKAILLSTELVTLDDNTFEYNNILETTGKLLVASEEDNLLYAELMNVRRVIFDLEREKDILENKIKLRIQGNEGIENMAKWSVQTREGMDTKRFKEENPELVEKYKKVSTLRVLRIK
jgi:hypothetical protein